MNPVESARLLAEREEAARQVRRAEARSLGRRLSPQDFEEFFRQLGGALRARGLCERLSYLYDPINDGYQVRADLGRVPTGAGRGEDRVYGWSFLRDEIAMGGERELEYWAERIQQDLRREAERHGRGGPDVWRAIADRIIDPPMIQRANDPRAPPPMTAREVLERQRAGLSEATESWEELALVNLERRFRAGLTSGENLLSAARVLLERGRISPADFVRAEQRAGEADVARRAADDKAAALFRSVAGEPAWQELEAGRHVVVRGGSSGTVYHLEKRASYCVVLPSDGTRLCAVVPGVPLYDHLLGIKLMIETDEPRFLKTANVSGRAEVQYGDELWRQLRQRHDSLFGPGRVA